MIDWKRKLTSRKWWMSIITLVSGLVLAFGIGEDKGTIITGCLMALASTISYTIGEGFTDSVAADKTEVSTDELKALIKEAMDDDQDGNT